MPVSFELNNNSSILQSGKSERRGKWTALKVDVPLKVDVVLIVDAPSKADGLLI